MTAERFNRQALAQPNEVAPLRTAVWRLALKSGASETVGNAIRLAVSEALTNVVMHAYVGGQARKMVVEAWSDGAQHFNVRVLDEGHVPVNLELTAVPPRVADADNEGADAARIDELEPR